MICQPVDGNSLPADLALARRKATLRWSLAYMPEGVPGGSASLMCEFGEGFLQPPEQPFPRACATLDPEQSWGDAPSGLCVNCSSAVRSALPLAGLYSSAFCFLGTKSLGLGWVSQQQVGHSDLSWRSLAATLHVMAPYLWASPAVTLPRCF